MADWRALGVQDGEAGRSLGHFEARTRACAKAGYASDFEEYRVGRDQGLRTYCTPERGWREGLAGSSYAGVCPAETASMFMAGYSDGKRAYDVLEAVRSAESSVESIRSRMDENEDNLRKNENVLRTEKLSPEDRKRFEAEVDKLRGQRSSLRRELDDARRTLDWRRFDVDRARMELGFRWGPW